MIKNKILVINPGSTSTKIGVFEDSTEIFETVLRHSSEEINKYLKIIDQYDFRKNVILDTLSEKGINLSELTAVVGRGGLLKPIEGGTYNVTPQMIEDLKTGLSESIPQTWEESWPLKLLQN